MNYQPIENYGAIGDLTTVALVGMNGSIDFMCFPHFDSPTIFAALLDSKKGGYFKIAPVGQGFKNRQRYLPDTNILLTTFLGDEGIAEVCDFMPMQHLGHSHSVMRRVKVLQGNIKFQMTCAPKFDYGRSGHRAITNKHEVIFAPNVKFIEALRLRSKVPLKICEGAATAEFLLHAEESAVFILEEAREDTPSSHPDYPSESFKETMNFWLSWIAHTTYRGRWRETVNRSALTLKLLTSLPLGSIVAAPTFGLPEHLGGQNNWDYRYTWIRDASFTLDALMRLGFRQEAESFMQWMGKRCEHLDPRKPLKVMYRMNGQPVFEEKILDHFEGYRKSAPVRIGNAAAKQSQLDIYGELLDAIFIYDRHGEPISYDFWTRIVTLVDWVCKNWRKPDEGIWEVRDGARPFLYSRAMCWTAIVRAIRLARARSFPAPLARWHGERDKIYINIHRNFWDPKLKSFVQYQGAKTVDGAALLLPIMKFISPKEPRWLATLKKIEQKLVRGSLVRRFESEKHAGNSMTGKDETFTACSFWYAECLSRAGDLRQARFVFEKALGFANHLGLYSEQLGAAGEHLGNFPQAFSHIALISAARKLDKKLNDENIPS